MCSGYLNVENKFFLNEFFRIFNQQEHSLWLHTRTKSQTLSYSCTSLNRLWQSASTLKQCNQNNPLARISSAGFEVMSFECAAHNRKPLQCCDSCWQQIFLIRAKPINKLFIINYLNFSRKNMRFIRCNSWFYYQDIVNSLKSKHNLTFDMQMEQIIEYVARYCCTKCHQQWCLTNTTRNRPALCKMCGMPAYPSSETIHAFFHVPRYRSISRLLSK